MIEVSDATKVLLLLLNNFDDSSQPLTGTQVRKLLDFAYSSKIEIEALSQTNEKLINSISKECNLSSSQLTHQLSYGFKLGIKINEWQKYGIWVISTLDYDYFPLDLLARGRNKISPLLFGAGKLSLLDKPSIGVVGSRDISPSSESYVKKAVARINDSGFSIVSGAAKGVDLIAMNESLENGHCVIGVLSSDLVKSAGDRGTISFINNDQLLLLSPEFPDSHWTIGRAMGRNKYIYLLSNAVLVGQITKDSGGTWTGINECSKNDWNDVFIKSSGLDEKLKDQLLKLNRVSLDSDFKLDELHTKDELQSENLRLPEFAAYLGKSITATKTFLSKNNLTCLDYSKPDKKVTKSSEENKQNELF